MSEVHQPTRLWPAFPLNNREIALLWVGCWRVTKCHSAMESQASDFMLIY